MNSTILLLSDIFADEEFNCRGNFNKIDVAELAQDIEKQTPILVDSLGLIQPITVRVLTSEETKKNGKPYGLVAGFRRFFAFQVLKRDRIPCNIIVGISANQAAIINLSENIKRKDLNVLQEAKALEKLHSTGIPRDHVAQSLGVSSGWVQTRYNLLELPESIQLEAAAGIINQKQIKEIWSLPTDQRRFEAVKTIKDARFRGEKASDIKIKEKKEDDPNKPKVRPRIDIFDMMKHVAGILGYGFETRLGAWCAGEIGTYDYLKDLKAEAEKRGLSYTIPTSGTIFDGE